MSIPIQKEEQSQRSYIDSNNNFLRRSTINVIENTPNPKIEHRFIKYPGKEAVDITDYTKSTEQEAWCEINLVKKVLRTDNSRLTDIHTHPNKIKGNIDTRMYSALPSANDMKRFMDNEIINTMVIAVRDVESGKVSGYHIFKKTKRTKKLNKDNLTDEITAYAFSLEIASGLGQPIEVWEKSFDPLFRAREFNRVLSNYVKKWAISRKIIAADGYTVDQNHLAFVLVNKHNIVQVDNY